MKELNVSSGIGSKSVVEIQGSPMEFVKALTQKRSHWNGLSCYEVAHLGLCSTSVFRKKNLLSSVPNVTARTTKDYKTRHLTL